MQTDRYHTKDQVRTSSRSRDIALHAPMRQSSFTPSKQQTCVGPKVVGNCPCVPVCDAEKHTKGASAHLLPCQARNMTALPSELVRSPENTFSAKLGFSAFVTSCAQEVPQRCGKSDRQCPPNPPWARLGPGMPLGRPKRARTASKTPRDEAQLFSGAGE